MERAVSTNVNESFRHFQTVNALSGNYCRLSIGKLLFYHYQSNRHPKNKAEIWFLFNPQLSFNRLMIDQYSSEI